MRLIFMGSPEFSVPALRALHDDGHDIVAVYTQPPRPAGRGKSVRRQPVHEAADVLGIPVRTPTRLRNNEKEWDHFSAYHAEVAVVAAYGLILPPEILNAPEQGCINIHASLLPRWRGASPIQSAIRAGDTESGITIMEMNEGLDTGDILVQQSTPILPDDTASSLHDRLATIGAELIVKTLGSSHIAIPQAEEHACYAPRLTRQDGLIDWSRSASEIDRQIRAFTPWPGSFTSFQGQTLRIGRAIPSSEAVSAPPGTLINDQLHVACGQGSLHITHLQKPGRAMMEASAFLRGNPLPKGARLG
ncbi:methionyl-tRNA formyltransferase [Saccharibacter sp. 17.LH.SD]|uniref:methionyl-tRNA formyltransferase n=1 Tax=Saccharibacter sp. 17.LH.SD TaxID=2689393 RepID=UPI00136EEF0A|nr:methionyl-tRNA formyltransferase [Saccharibacter sp. 17.LH.SD]MXV44112.1 methionyl-tRNA formyltransferase [Saccharibacter sp. 17.LH.SD]